MIIYNETLTEDKQFYVEDIVCLCSMIVIGIIFNLFVPTALYFERSLRTANNFFILNIIIVDLLVCGYILPVTLLNRILSRNTVGQLGCQINSFLTFLSMGINNFLFMIISFDRYLFIFYRSLHSKWFTVKRVILLLLLIWTIWLVYGISLSFLEGFSYISVAFVCFISDNEENLGLIIILIVLNFVLPTLVSTCFYTILLVRMFKIKYNVSKPISCQSPDMVNKKDYRNETRLVGLLIMNVVVYFICWAPYTFHGFLIKDDSEMSPLMHRVIHWLTLANSVFNGLLFGVLNSKFRNVIKKRLISKNKIDDIFSSCTNS
uniref:GCR028 n=1 Tax=Schmidtea mediterranea TaxID=79327 RepID=A0A193KU71_SCHMD|nr:GCR028 [Schmidtea mediterranea]